MNSKVFIHSLFIEEKAFISDLVYNTACYKFYDAMQQMIDRLDAYQCSVLKTIIELREVTNWKVARLSHLSICESSRYLCYREKFLNMHPLKVQSLIVPLLNNLGFDVLFPPIIDEFKHPIFLVQIRLRSFEPKLIAKYLQSGRNYTYFPRTPFVFPVKFKKQNPQAKCDVVATIGSKINEFLDYQNEALQYSVLFRDLSSNYFFVSVLHFCYQCIEHEELFYALSDRNLSHSAINPNDIGCAYNRHRRYQHWISAFLADNFDLPSNESKICQLEKLKYFNRIDLNLVYYSFPAFIIVEDERTDEETDFIR